MDFGSFIFLGWFLPFLFAIYYLTPSKIRNWVLIVFNLVFITYGTISSPMMLAIIMASMLFNYLIGLCLIKSDKAGLKRFAFVFGVVLNIGILFAFKYLNFFFEVIQLKLSLELILPVGISFYTFQSVSYLSDVYNGKTKGTTSLLKFLNYMLLFPQFISGPIVRYPSVEGQLEKRHITVSQFFHGLELFIIGLGLKTMVADQLSGLWFQLGGIGYDSLSTPLAWVGIIGYSIQLFLDFSGYSMMAIGLGECLGFTLPDNFNYPYMSLSMTEFWRRWHMTLGSWFRDYVYIPLGGNRKGAVRTYFNLFVVWFLTGLWHGASWNFILWGLLLFVIIVIEKAFLKRFLDKVKVVGHIYMIILIPLSWMIFAIEDMEKLGMYAKRLIGIGGIFIYEGDVTRYLSQYGIFLAIGILLCTNLPRKIFDKITNKIVRWIILLAILGGSCYMIHMGMNNPFMYFKF